MCIRDRLDDRARQIIKLRFFEGKTQIEVAEEINISQAQVSRLSLIHILKDSAHIQEFEAEWKNRKARRAGRPEVTPMSVSYTHLDVYKRQHQSFC